MPDLLKAAGTALPEDAATATLAGGTYAYRFASWGDDCSASGASTTCTYVWDTSDPVVATASVEFAVDTHVLTVTQPAHATISTSDATLSCTGSVCTATVDFGTVVTLTITPDVGYQFVAWTGDCTGSGTCSVTMTESKTVSATFVPQSYTLTVTPPTNGTVTGLGISCPGTCSASFAYGTSVGLTATPAAGDWAAITALAQATLTLRG